MAAYRDSARDRSPLARLSNTDETDGEWIDNLYESHNNSPSSFVWLSIGDKLNPSLEAMDGLLVGQIKGHGKMRWAGDCYEDWEN